MGSRRALAYTVVAHGAGLDTSGIQETFTWGVLSGVLLMCLVVGAMLWIKR